MENNIQKINKMGKIGYVVSNICTIMLHVATVACIVAGIMLLAVPYDAIKVTTSHTAMVEVDKVNSSALVTFETDGMTVEIDGLTYNNISTEETLAKSTTTAATTPYTYSLRDVYIVFFVGAAVCIVFSLLMKNIRDLFASFRDCETPFTAEISDKLQKIGFLFIPVMMGEWVITAVQKYISTGIVDIAVNIDLTMILLIVMVLTLASVFRHGTMLQQESDETL